MNVKVECCKSNSLLPIKVDERGDGIYNISFMPELAAKHLVFVTFNQQNVKGSPFELYADNRKENVNSKIARDNFKLDEDIQAIGDGLRLAHVGCAAFFELYGNFDMKKVHIEIKGFFHNGSTRALQY